jgi:hypothetical protein
MTEQERNRLLGLLEYFDEIIFSERSEQHRLGLLKREFRLSFGQLVQPSLVPNPTPPDPLAARVAALERDVRRLKTRADENNWKAVYG